ncbi:aspartate carbamoyltransferase catalytic subunit [Aquiluna borgnonia]|uniref:Aspartate carbamoyltransferase n=1 Tax=Aquiluna borgnonia TaxID=2499157 RepID=A0A7D4UDC1_9MICO|nr:aspartate carbamoyltransferase catalytic subunit [Aquiluna borgnonia]QKJ25274.1 aspartate carbamoyltransferase catalytic subunit [Aquiluna borgnonia]
MRHLTSIRELTRESAIALLDNAQELAQVGDREVKKLPALRGKTVVNLFFENSTRTRISFEIAAKRLSADVINVSAESSSVSKGESLKDTAQTLEALGADAIVLRHPMSGAPKILAAQGWTKASIVNAGDGSHEHPTQALLDALTLRQVAASSTDLAGLRVLIVGDILHSRVARSNILLLNLLGANVEICGPEALVPSGIEELGASISHSFDQALERNPDAVMMLRIQKERMDGSYFESPAAYGRDWSLNSERLSKLRLNTKILHPGPMNRGLEISAEAADDSRSLVLRQVANGVAVRMAVLHNCLSSGGES